MRRLFLAFALCFPVAAVAQPRDAVIVDIVDGHVLPGYADLTASAIVLETAAANSCAPESPELRSAYGDAFDAWIHVSHLRFGPAEAENRAFALAFWPDTRGATPKALAALIADQDAAVDDPDEFATVSVAARGFYALEFLLYDEAFAPREAQGYHCDLIRTTTADIVRTATAIEAGWTESHADAMRMPEPASPYRDTDEVLRVFYTALTTGLQTTSDLRLGRPLGTFDRPRPNRAEAYRSGRSLHHVSLSLEALRDLAARLAVLVPDAKDDLDAAFAHALDRAGSLDDPTLAGVADPASRFRIEDLKQRVDDIRAMVGAQIAPALGIAAGFNSMDGD